MPTAPPHPCTFPSCAVLIPHGKGSRCDKHKQQPRADGRKPFAGAVRTEERTGLNLYGSARWQKARATHIRHSPYCRACGAYLWDDAVDRPLPGATVDHDPPFTDSASFWDTSTWRSLCASCHNRHTGRTVAERRKDRQCPHGDA